MLNIVGRRYWYFGLSLLVIIPGMIALGLWGLPLAIDFTGGSLLEVRFDSGDPPAPADVVELYETLEIGDALVQSAGTADIIARSKPIDEATKTTIMTEMEKRFGGPITVLRFDSVGPSVGAEVAQRAVGAVGLAALGILAYITYAFRGVPHAFRYGFAAIIAMLHDVAVVVGVEAIFGHFLGWEVDALFLTALLTVIGFSVHDSIVVFDRIRENLRKYHKDPLMTIINKSVNQTLGRTILTSLTTLMVVIILFVLGGGIIHDFAFALIVGVLVGTYSSIFVASPILLAWQKRS